MESSENNTYAGGWQSHLVGIFSILRIDMK